MANQTKYRVLRITSDLQAQMASRREARGETNATIIATAVQDHLPALVTSLQALGFAPGGKRKPARLPVTEEALSALSVASKAVRVPASALLLLCVGAATGTQGKAAPTKNTEKPASKTPRPTLDEIKGLVDRKAGVPKDAPKTRKRGAK